MTKLQQDRDQGTTRGTNLETQPSATSANLKWTRKASFPKDLNEAPITEN